MRYPQELNRAAKALRVAQRCAAESAFDEVTNRLRDEPCVAFALTCGSFFDWSPEVDIAVRMLSIARDGRPVENGHLIWGLQPERFTPAAIKSGLEAVATCIALLKQSSQPFEFLAHVDGQSSIEFHSGTGEGDSRLRQLADAIADEVRSLSD